MSGLYELSDYIGKLLILYSFLRTKMLPLVRYLVQISLAVESLIFSFYAAFRTG